MWTELGHAKPTSWKARAHRLGEKLMDRIECEEWALKGVERGLVPPGLVQVAVDEQDASGKERVEEAKTLQDDGIKDREEVVRLFGSLVERGVAAASPDTTPSTRGLTGPAILPTESRLRSPPDVPVLPRSSCVLPNAAY